MNLSSITIGIIGAGNMGQSIIHGLMSSQNPPKILILDSHPEKIASLLENPGITLAQDTQNLMNQSDVVVLAVKPQSFGQVFSQMKGFKQSTRPLILSVAAGIRLIQIQNGLDLPDDYPLIRVMPNTPAMLQMGASGVYGKNLNPENKAVVDAIVGAIGQVVWIEDESQMDIVTALSGSGPAYFFYFCHLLIKAATQLGLPEEAAKTLTLQTGLGATQMAMHSELTLEELTKQVTSPGGTTQAGLEVLKTPFFEQMIQQVIQAATHRGQTLSADLKIDLED